jgi:hypothetical protein
MKTNFVEGVVNDNSKMCGFKTLMECKLPYFRLFEIFILVFITVL